VAYVFFLWSWPLGWFTSPPVFNFAPGAFFQDDPHEGRPVAHPTCCFLLTAYVLRWFQKRTRFSKSPPPDCLHFRLTFCPGRPRYPPAEPTFPPAWSVFPHPLSRLLLILFTGRCHPYTQNKGAFAVPFFQYLFLPDFPLLRVVNV